MNQKEPIEFIKKAGACIVSKNIINETGKLKWILREKSIDAVDNGWRFFSENDDDEYINNPDNLVVCDFNTVANIEPAILGIYELPIGSDLQLVSENGKIRFVDNLTGKEVWRSLISFNFKLIGSHGLDSTIALPNLDDEIVSLASHLSLYIRLWTDYPNKTPYYAANWRYWTDDWLFSFVWIWKYGDRQFALDLAGLIPVVGVVSDGVNGVIYAARGML